MLTLEPGSLCDVCADEFGPRNLPHCIPCGHILCVNCCNNILEKTTSRLAPVCPFCREQFSRGSVRLIRIDFNGPSSGWSTPRRSPNSPRPPLIEDDFPNDLLLKASAPSFPDSGEARAREGRMLETKVARVASKKCSVEEVTALQQEVDRWLTEVAAADASSALYLSSLLLKAILANHVAFSEATKAAKHAEASLKLKVEELELEKGRLEVELHKQKVQYKQKVQECQSLRTELSRFVTTPAAGPAVSTASASAHVSLSSASRSSASPPSSRVASPTASPSYLTSPLSRLGISRSASVAPSAHGRSASVAPATPTRAASTAPTRIATPGLPSTAHRSATPVPSYRSTTPASPSPIRKSRTMSISQQPPLPPSDRWPPSLTAALANPSAHSATSRPLGPRVPARA